MKKRLTTLAKKITRNNSDYNLVAFVVKGGNIISFGFNNMRKSHPVHFRVHQEFDKGIHAEFDALRQVQHQDLRNAKLFVIRFKKNGELGNSKPCKHCQEYITKSGVGKVLYIEDGIWKKL